MSSHVKIVGVLFVVFGALCVLSAFVLGIIFGVLATVIEASGDPDRRLAVTLFGLTGAAAVIAFLVASLPSIICGWGLVKHRSWARILGIILAAISLVAVFPYSTIFGVYALWVLLNKKTEPLFGGPAFRQTGS